MRLRLLWLGAYWAVRGSVAFFVPPLVKKKGDWSGRPSRRHGLAVAMGSRRRGRTLRELASAYDRLLRRHPIVTKMVTGALVELVGDAVAQRIEGGRLDGKRMATVCLDGLLTGVVLHHVYAVQARRLPPSNAVWWVPWAHMAIDELLVDPGFVALFLVVTDCDWNRFLPAVTASKAVALTTLPVQYLNFRFNPVRYRVFVVNLIDVIWSAAVSFSAHAPSVRATVS